MVAREQNPSASGELPHEADAPEVEATLLHPTADISAEGDRVPYAEEDQRWQQPSWLGTRSWAKNATSAAMVIKALNQRAKAVHDQGLSLMRAAVQDWVANSDAAAHTQGGIRGLALRIVDWEYFETVILVCICINCVLLALYDPLNQDRFQEVTKHIETALLCIFALEIVVKMLAYGVCGGRRAFFRSGWNWLDLFVVLVGIPGHLFDDASDAESFTVVRCFRVLRPLRTITRVPGLAVLVETLLECFSGMLPALVIFMGFFLLFGVTGCQMFMGQLNQDCYDASTHELDVAWGRKCGYIDCPQGDICAVSQTSPNFNTTNFNDVYHAIITIFVAMTLEGWVDVMYALQDSYSLVAATIYFLLIVLIGSFCVLQLTMAIVSNQYEVHSNAMEEKKRLEDAKLAQTTVDQVTPKENEKDSATVVEPKQDITEEKQTSIESAIEQKQDITEEKQTSTELSDVSDGCTAV